MIMKATEDQSKKETPIGLNTVTSITIHIWVVPILLPTVNFSTKEHLSVGLEKIVEVYWNFADVASITLTCLFYLGAS